MYPAKKMRHSYRGRFKNCQGMVTELLNDHSAGYAVTLHNVITGGKVNNC